MCVNFCLHLPKIEKKRLFSLLLNKFIGILFLIIFFANLKVTLWMIAHRTDLWSLRSYYDMSAIATLPDFDLALCKYLRCFYVFEKRAESLFMALFDCADCAEFLCYFRKAFFFRRLSVFLIHVRPLKVLAACRIG